MTPEKRSASERLKEIEAWHVLPETVQQVGPQSHFDMNWLIARVKRLEAALEKIADENEDREVGKFARKALSEDDSEWSLMATESETK